MITTLLGTEFAKQVENSTKRCSSNAQKVGNSSIHENNMKHGILMEKTPSVKVVKAKNQKSQGRRARDAHAWEKDNIAQHLSPLFRTAKSLLLVWLALSLKTPSTGARFESKAKSRYRAANINIIYIFRILVFSFIHPYINEDDTLERYHSSTPISFILPQHIPNSFDETTSHQQTAI